MTDNALPTISIIIPVKPGLKPEAVEALRTIDYPQEKIEIFTVYGKNPSYQRNVAVSKTSNEILFFLDNDSMPARETLKKLVGHISGDVVIAGGPSIMPEEAPAGAYIFGKTLESYLCTAGSSCRYVRKGEGRYATEKEIILCNMVMRKEDFLKFGGLNERLYPNEENELMEKVKHAGKKIYYDPDAYVIRMPRRTIRSFVRQIFNYGRGRGEQTVYYPKSFNIFNFMPLLFVIYLIVSMATRGFMLYPLILYAAILIVDGIIKTIREKSPALLLLPFSSFLLHTVYGIGTAYGMLSSPFKQPVRGELKIEKVS